MDFRAMEEFKLVETVPFVPMTSSVNMCVERRHSRREVAQVHVDEAVRHLVTRPLVPSTKKVSISQAQQNSGHVATRLCPEEAARTLTTGPLIPSAGKVHIFLAQQNSHQALKMRVEEVVRPSGKEWTSVSVADEAPRPSLPLRRLPRRPAADEISETHFQYFQAARVSSPRGLPQRHSELEIATSLEQAAGVSSPEDLALDIRAATSSLTEQYKTIALNAFEFEHDGSAQRNALKENIHECKTRDSTRDDETQSEAVISLMNELTSVSLGEEGPQFAPTSQLKELHGQYFQDTQMSPEHEITTPPDLDTDIVSPGDLPWNTYANAAMLERRYCQTKASNAFTFEYFGFVQVSASRENSHECTIRYDNEETFDDSAGTHARAVLGHDEHGDDRSDGEIYM